MTSKYQISFFLSEKHCFLVIVKYIYLLCLLEIIVTLQQRSKLHIKRVNCLVLLSKRYMLIWIANLTSRNVMKFTKHIRLHKMFYPYKIHDHNYSLSTQNIECPITYKQLQSPIRWIGIHTGMHSVVEDVTLWDDFPHMLHLDVQIAIGRCELWISPKPGFNMPHTLSMMLKFGSPVFHGSRFPSRKGRVFLQLMCMRTIIIGLNYAHGDTVHEC